MPNSRTVPSQIYLAAGSDQVQFAAGEEGEQKLRKFTGVAYTGVKVRANGWGIAVVTDLAGLSVSKKPRPILRDHDLGKEVGHTTKIEVSARQIYVEGVISGVNADAERIVNASDNEFPWQMSIGASVEKVVFLEEGETASVNGRKVSGPCYIVRQAVLNEVSFVALGADDHTSAKVAAIAARSTVGVIDMTFDQWLKDQGVDDGSALPEKAMKKLRQQFDAEQNPAPPPAPPANPPAKKSNLDEIVQAAREDELREERITQLARQHIQERPAQLEQIENLARAAILEKKAPDEFELQLLRATRPQTGGIGVRRSSSQVDNKVIECALCMSAGLGSEALESSFSEQTLDLAKKHFPNGIGMNELMLMAARERGCTHLSMRGNLKEVLQFAFQSDLRMGGFSTISVSGILANTANKFLIDAFNAVDSAWRMLAAIRNVQDFKQITSYSLTGDLQYEKIGPTGEIPHGTLGEESYTNQADTYAKMLAITRRDFINDDLGALSTAFRRLGRGGALKLNDVFWTTFLNNTSFFTAGRNNFDDGASDTVFSADNLIRADAMFRNQTDPDGKPLGAMPAILAVPPALRIPALRLMNSQTVYKDTDGGGSNPWSGAFRVASSPYMANTAYTGASALKWYLLADPNDIPVIEVAFLNGREAPTVESAEADFSTMGVQMRGYHDFGAALQEYRGGVAFKGEN